MIIKYIPALIAVAALIWLGVKFGQAQTWYYNCPDAKWTGPLELTDFKQVVELGFCPDGVVLWRNPKGQN
jgi:hypothetical protein